jgi:RNA polymerase sigma-70 factor (ECF subfamily)
MDSLVQLGRADAFVRLLAQHQRSVYALILSLVPNWADADEILQETNVRLWEQFEKYEPGTDFGAWSRAIAKYQVMTYRKKKGRQREQFTDAFIDQVADELERCDLHAERHQALSRCLERLPERSRELLRDYYAPHAAPREVAARCGRTLESLRLSLFRLRRALRDCIDRRLSAEASQ